MATYKYKMADLGRETYNYVNYSIAPDYDRPIYDGDQITVNGSFVCKDFDVRYLSCFLFLEHEENQAWVLSGRWEANISVAKGKSYAFTAKFAVDSSAYDGARSMRGIRARLSIEINELRPLEGMGSGAYFDSDDDHRFLLNFYHLDPKVLAMDFERATADGKWADDGQYLQCKTLKIAKNSQAVLGDFTKATITCTGSDGSSRSVNLTQAQLTTALTSNGYSETKPGIFSNFISALGVDYTLTLTLGDGYDQATFADAVMRSFARLHLSGAKNGGVAVGMFSTSTDDAPKFEVADTHKTFLYGGVESFGQGEARVNSLAALGIRAGTALPATAEDGDIFLLYKA